MSMMPCGHPNTAVFVGDRSGERFCMGCRRNQAGIPAQQHDPSIARNFKSGEALQRLDEEAGAAWSLRKVAGRYEVSLRGEVCGVAASLTEAVSEALGE